MRFVPTNCMREGMELAKTLYGRNSELLLNCGMVLDQNYINSIKRLKYPGVYINDDLSKDIEVVNVISDNLRNETISGIKKIYVMAEKSGSQIAKESDLTDQIGDIVEELLENKGMMVNMIDLKCFDNYTYSHSVNVAVFSIIVGIALGLKKEMLVRLGLGALMHDIGKVFIDKEIVNKPAALTNEEFAEMKKHLELGYQYVKEKYNLPALSCAAIIDHHEKYDGSGYPNGKQKEDISLFGRIIAVSDVYDALTSERPYREAMDPSESMEYIMSGVDTLFDSEIVHIFMHKVAPYPIGMMVELSNNWSAIVVENFEEFCLRPKVRIFEKEGIHVAPFDISLKDDMNYRNVTIRGIVKQ